MPCAARVASAHRVRKIPRLVPQPERERDDAPSEFLRDAGLPFVARAKPMLANASAVLAAAASIATIAPLMRGEAFALSADAALGGAPASAATAVLAWLSWMSARGGWIERSGILFFAGLAAWSALASCTKGAFYVGWNAQPFFALAASACLGIVPGLSLGLLGSVVMFACASSGAKISDPALADSAWLHAASLAALTLACSLVGALMHSALQTALRAGARVREEKVEAARALRHSEKLLRHAMRVETVGDLAGLVSHQLRNAFQVMLGQAALHELDDSDRAGERLRLVGDTLSKTKPLLDQLMELAHPEDGSIESCDLSAWLASFVERVRAVMPSAIHVRWEPPASPVPAQIELRGLEHSLWNLAINARHAMPEGGTLTFAANESDGMAVVIVRDTGCGIPQDLQQKIFDPYVTTKPLGEGTGLGLTAVARFVLKSQGRIEVVSAEGKGAEFTLRFPLAAAVGEGAVSAT